MPRPAPACAGRALAPASRSGARGRDSPLRVPVAPTMPARAPPAAPSAGGSSTRANGRRRASDLARAPRRPSLAVRAGRAWQATSRAVVAVARRATQRHRAAARGAAGRFWIRVASMDERRERGPKPAGQGRPGRHARAKSHDSITASACRRRKTKAIQKPEPGRGDMTQAAIAPIAPIAPGHPARNAPDSEHATAGSRCPPVRRAGGGPRGRAKSRDAALARRRFI